MRGGEGGTGPDGSTTDPEPGPISGWRRWRDGVDVPFHRYCDVYPAREDVSPPLEENWLFYTTGPARVALRYTPVFILLGAVAIGVVQLADGGSELRQLVSGIGVDVQVPLLLAGVVWLVLLVWLASDVDLHPRSDLLGALVVYGTLLFLLADAVYWFVQVTVAMQRGTVDQLGGGSLLPGSGYLLALFIGGHLVYDGMLRTENMFSRLHEKRPPIVGPPDPGSYETNAEKATALEDAGRAYESTFLAEFKKTLEHETELGGWSWLPTESTVSIPTAYLFAGVFVFPFFLIRLPGVVESVVLSLLGVVEVLVFFQFLVLMKFFHGLLTRHGPYEDPGGDGFSLLYQPDHPDGYAGFRDLGQFAIRVNLLLFFGGLYTAYWIYASGIPSLPAGERWVLGGEFMVWAFHYLGPLLVYVLTVVVWAYSSFWQIHKAMRKGRERRIELEISDIQDGELPDAKRDFKQAPIWPLNVGTFVSIVIGDTIPLLSLVPLI